MDRGRSAAPSRNIQTTRSPALSRATVNGPAAKDRAAGRVTVQVSASAVPLETARQPFGSWKRVTPGAEAAVWV
jgi:hypothetical protein